MLTTNGGNAMDENRSSQDKGNSSRFAFSGLYQARTLRRIRGIGPTYQAHLKDAGYSDTASLVGARSEKVARIAGVDVGEAEDWIAQAEAHHTPPPEPYWTEHLDLEQLYGWLLTDRQRLLKKEERVFREFFLRRDYTFDGDAVGKFLVAAQLLEAEGKLERALFIRGWVHEATRGRTSPAGSIDYWLQNSRYSLSEEDWNRAREDFNLFQPMRKAIADEIDAHRKIRARVLEEVLRRELGENFSDSSYKEQAQVLKPFGLRSGFPESRCVAIYGWMTRNEDVAEAVGCSEGYANSLGRLGVRTPSQPNRAVPNIGSGVRETILERDGHQCLRCGSGKDLTIHHVLPVSEGGSNSHGNLATLCLACHKWSHDGVWHNVRYDDAEEFWNLLGREPPEG